MRPEQRAAPKARSKVPRPHDDCYITPEAAVLGLLRYDDVPEGPIFDPACGTGGIARPLRRLGRKVHASNLFDRGFGRRGVDFLKMKAPPAPIMICNPPYFLLFEFIDRALALDLDYMALLLRSEFPASRSRYARYFKWPHRRHAVQLQMVERLTFYSADLPIEDQAGWDSQDFSWFIWRRGWPYETVQRWCSLVEAGLF